MTHLAPLFFGTLALLALATLLAFEKPSPGPLARAHADLPEALAACGVCHTDRGLDHGCLKCHSEIAVQLRDDRGYHAFLIGDGAPDCARCHADHHGRDFELVRADPQFDHPHIEFALHGRHDDLACDACHGADTHLGRSQSCETCHGNPHAEARFLACESCHGQDTDFAPASRFDHTGFLALTRGHANVSCDRCHSGFGEVRGKTCAECHPDPHRTDWGATCEACHGTEARPWSAATLSPAQHARTGFPLAAPHDAARCDACHKEGFLDRGPDDCAACHVDVHDGQFAPRGCLDCHARDRFVPALYEHDSFALRGAHREAACADCHERGRFAGTPRRCASCHEDEHRGQFGKEPDCARCHTETSFLPARYDAKDHDAFPLYGAHRAVSCRGCHEKGRFVGTPQACASCHTDPHGAQFARAACTACHRADSATFAIRPFDHAARTGHALEGAHTAASCVRCHKLDRRRRVRVYRGTPTRCASCHTDVHRGQFEARCTACHSSQADWKRLDGFDHDKQTRFALDRRHRRAACGQCHPAVRQPDGSTVVQYRPLGRECRDCHDFKER